MKKSKKIITVALACIMLMGLAVTVPASPAPTPKFKMVCILCNGPLRNNLYSGYHCLNCGREYDDAGNLIPLN